MEGEGKAFRPIHVSVCSAITGEARFPGKDGIKPPIPAPWRNNLTALSQSHNLYFVVHSDQLYVYKPDFPSQKIGSSAELVIDLPISRPGLVGYIGPRKPHAVNHLVLGDLGNEEIILLGCDDGDVLAYTTRSISNALLAEKLEKSEVQTSIADPKPFFMRNVGSSAWGLAIHKVSRMIAVSANTHKIVVFAFALHHKGPQDEEEVSESNLDNIQHDEIQSFEDQTSDRAKQFSDISDRCSNLEIILEGHHTNIPSISFCNTDSDQVGRYLVSTDIEGVTIIWDIWARQVIKQHLWPKDVIDGDSLTPWMRNWGVLCLEKECFRATEGISETFGCKPEYIKGRCDISGAHGWVEDASPWHPTYSRYTSVPGVSHTVESESISNGSNGSAGDSDYESAELDWLDRGDEEDELGMDSTDDNSFVIDNERPPGARVMTPTRAGPWGNQSKCESLPFSILYTTETEISLIPNPLVKAAVSMTGALHQHIPPHLYWLKHFERINMVLQIPELGIIVAACQTGRVALLTLTWMKSTSYYAFRLDWILPFKSQEDQGVRPTVPLLGIAVGPIQGRELASESIGGSSPHGMEKEPWRAIESSRRYRLILYYYEHTVLSYEIGRTAIDKEKFSTSSDILLF